MKAIILAAGIGSRLNKITLYKPKTLVEVNNKPILSYILNALEKNSVNEIVMCIGYMSETVIEYCTKNFPEINFHFIINDRYLTTNNMFSLFLAKEYMKGEVIILNADLVFDQSVITSLINCPNSCVAVDKGAYSSESMKVIVSGDRIEGISKKITQNESYGSSIDVYKFNEADLNLMIKEMDRIINKEKDCNQWTELMMDNLFKAHSINAQPVNISGMKWFEIDNFEDLAQAEILFNDKIRKLHEKKYFIIDRDGTLTIGNKLIENADIVIKKLKEAGKKIFILTNNSSKTPDQHLATFNSYELDLKPENVLVSIQPAIDYLINNNISEIYLCANKSVKKFVEDHGIITVSDNPQALLLTYNDEIEYKQMTEIAYLLQNQKIPYFATHSDVRCPTSDGYVPDLGSFIKMFEMTTGRKPDKIFGKPGTDFIDYINNKYSASSDEIVIIGDRLYTDIKLANEAKINSVLVLSGETKRDDYEFSESKADIIVPDISFLSDYIKNTDYVE